MSVTMRTLFMGPAHIITAVSENWDSRNFDRVPIGMPAAEAWPDPAWEPVQVAMSEVLRTGIGVTMQMPGGPFRVSPYRRDGRVVGTVTSYLFLRPMPVRPHPPERETAPTTSS